jgi:hypothetical protein
VTRYAIFPELRNLVALDPRKLKRLFRRKCTRFETKITEQSYLMYTLSANHRYQRNRWRMLLCMQDDRSGQQHGVHKHQLTRIGYHKSAHTKHFLCSESPRLSCLHLQGKSSIFVYYYLLSIWFLDINVHQRQKLNNVEGECKINKSWRLLCDWEKLVNRYLHMCSMYLMNT